MLHLKIITMLIAAVLIQGCASPHSGKKFDSPDGKWGTGIDSSAGRISLGIMTFSGNEKATYTYRNGRILFDRTDDLGEWKGHWVEKPMSFVTCVDEIDGSITWGVAIFQFNEAYTRFKGTYDKCGDGRTGAWDGRRI